MTDTTAMLTETEILKALTAGFASRYGGEARLFFAPGRVNLIGEHTDYNGGHVFPCALSFGTYAAARKRQDRRVLLASLNVGAGHVSDFSLDSLTKSGNHDWTDYPKGVIKVFEDAGYKLPTGFEILFYGNIPAGSGLSSSASLEVLTGLVLRELFELPEITGIDLARFGQKAENEFVGMNCGIMDQFASAMGKKDHAIYLDTNTLTYEYAPLTMPDAKIVITNSQVKHKLASSEYNTRRAECEQAVREISALHPIETLGELTPAEFEEVKTALSDEVLIRRAKHAVTENARTLEAAEALKSGDLTTFGRLMNASHDSLQYDYEVSCPEIDFLVAEGRKLPGVIGSRITGGGFGGCTVSLVKNEDVDSFRTILGTKYREEYNLCPAFYIAEPGEGAHELKG